MPDQVTPDNEGRINKDLWESMRKDPPPAKAPGCSLRFLWLVVAGWWVLGAAGCASQNRLGAQVGFQPGGQGNTFQVMRDGKIAGDDAGGGIDKSTSTSLLARIWGEAVTVSTLPTSVMISACIALALMLLFMAWTINRMLAYRQGLLVTQQAIADEGNGDLVAALKPRVRAMGAGRKRLYDSVLMEVRHG